MAFGLMPAQANEICNGIASKTLADPVATDTTCTATTNITLDPGEPHLLVPQSVTLSLYAPEVSFIGPLGVQGMLRIAPSNPIQDKVWNTSLTLVEVSALDTNRIQVAWLPVDDGVTPGEQISYEIHVSQDKDFLAGTSTLKHQKNGIDSVEIGGLSPGQTYYVRMLASTPSGFTSQSRQHRILMPAAAPVRTTSQPVVNLPAGSILGTTASSVTLAAGSAIPAVDDVISSEDPPLLRRVAAVTTNGDGSITLQTGGASLDEVFERLQLNSSITLAGIPATSNAGSRAYGQHSGVLRTTGGSGENRVHWQRSHLTLSADTPSRLVNVAPASLIRNMRIAALQQVSGGQLYSEGASQETKGTTLSISGPQAVAIVPGASGSPTLSLSLADPSQQELCSVDNLEIDAPGGKNASGLVSIGALNNLGGGQYQVSLPINAMSAHVADSAYRVRVTAYVDDIGDNCSGGNWTALWRETLDFEFDLFVASQPNFPVNEETTLTYSGGFSITNTVNYTFAPTLELEMKLDGASLDYVRLQGSADASFTQELRIEATASASIDKTNTLFQRQFIKVFFAGNIPIVMKGTLSANLRIQGAVNGAMSAVETLQMGFDELTFGFEYRNGSYMPIKSIEPAYSLTLHGDADAEANLVLSLLPALEVTFYELATGKLVTEPYLVAEAGIHGQIHRDMTWDATTVDMDYWLTKGSIEGGLNLWLYADLQILDFTLLQWPSGADSDQYDTFHKVALIEQTPILGLPTLAAMKKSYGYPGNSRALRFDRSYQTVPNPFKHLFNVGPDTFISFGHWHPPKVIAANDQGYQVLPPPDDEISHDSVWIDFDRPGIYTVRLGGSSSLGRWARQVADDIYMTLTDNDNDGMIDQWESHYGVSDPQADPDNDGLNNLGEFQQARRPDIADPPISNYQWAYGDWNGCEGSCEIGQGVQFRNVWCETVDGNIVVLDSHCDASSEPTDQQACNVPPPLCPASHPLNDTGITWGGDYPSGNNITCTSNVPVPQDCHHGRDATDNDDSDGHAGFSFTRLGDAGAPLANNASNWACVKDNVSGLVWEVKTDDGGLHDKDDRYVWYNTDSSANGGNPGDPGAVNAYCYGFDSTDPGSYCNTQAFVSRVNQAGLCGYTDWRLPSIEELLSLTDYSRVYPQPRIDTDYFPNTVLGTHWSSTSNPGAASSAFGINNGSISTEGKNEYWFVRLVRGGQ